VLKLQANGNATKYSGITIGEYHRIVAFWKPVIEKKIKSRLSRWKGRLLPMNGRVCLLKSIINDLPLFYLSFFKAPCTICKIIRKLQAKFLWGWSMMVEK